MDKLLADIAAGSKEKTKKKTSAAAHGSRSNTAAGNAAASSSGADRSSQSGAEARERRREMVARRRAARPMTAEDKAWNERFWKKQLRRERHWDSVQKLAVQYADSGAGYMEDRKGVAMIYSLTMFHGDKVYTPITPSETRFTIDVKIRVWRENKFRLGGGYWDPVHIKTYPQDEPSFEQGMAPGEAMHKIHEALDRGYVWWRYTDVTVNPVMPAHRPAMVWAERVLRAGLPVIDDSFNAGQREHCLQTTFEERADGECFAGQLTELLTTRAQRQAAQHHDRADRAANARYRIDTRTEEERRGHYGGAVFADRNSIIAKLNEWCPNRNAADGLPGGMTVMDIDAVCKRLELYFIALDLKDVVRHVADYRTEAQKRNHNTRRTCIITAGHGHVYMLPDNDEATHIVKSVGHLANAIGAHIQRSEAESLKTGWSNGKRIVDDRRVVRLDESLPLPEFDQLEPVIYQMSHARVHELYALYMSTVGRIPDRRLLRYDGRNLREFTIFLHAHKREGMCTFFSCGSEYRCECYVRLCEGTLKQIYSDDRYADTPPGHFAIMHMSDGPGKVVHQATQAVLGVRLMPSSETKQRVLQRQDNMCRLCHDEFTTSEFVKDGDNRLSEDEVRPCWEHLRPHADGGRDVTEANIGAVCLTCMLEKNGRERTCGAYRGVEREYTSTYNPTARAEFFRHTEKAGDERNENRVLAMIRHFTDEVPEGHIVVSVDMTKCRRFWLCGEGATLGWPVYCVNDEILPFDGEPNKLGKYYVRTKDSELLHGDNWYPHCAVMCALRHKIIELGDIKLMYRPARVLPRNYFEKIMRELEKHITAAHAEVVAKGADVAEAKAECDQMYKDFLGNLPVGLAGKTRNVVHKEVIELDYEAALEKAHQADIYSVTSFTMECNGRECYRVSTTYTEPIDGCKRNIYQDVLWFERLALFEMAQEVRAQGGTVMHLKTDEVAFHIHPDNWDPRVWETRTYEHVKAWQDSKCHPQTGKPLRFKVGVPKGLKTRNHIQLCCQGRPDSDLPRVIPQWRTPPIDLTTPFTLADPNFVLPPQPPDDPHALPATVGMLSLPEIRKLGERIVASGKSLLITGEGGSGKTFFETRGLVPALWERKIRYLLATPTLKTRQALRGYEHCENACTMQHLYKSYAKSSKRLLGVLGIHDVHEPFYLVMDEVSMFDEGMWEMLAVLKHKVPGLRTIFFGDFQQLPPVTDPWLKLQEDAGTGIETYEDSAVLRDLCDGNRMVFTHSHRLAPGERRFRAVCRAARRGEEIDVDEFEVTDRFTLTNICYTNSKVREVNEMIDAHFLETHAAGVTPVFVPRYHRKRTKYMDLRLVPGTRLVGIASGGTRGNEIWNKERYVVISVDENELVLETYESEHTTRATISTEKASKLLSLGWAFTYYHVQGATLRDRFTIYDWHHFYSSARARYVVLTRAVHGSQVQIDGAGKHMDSLRPADGAEKPSERATRMEFIDSAAWLQLRERVCHELNPQNTPAGLAYFKRIASGIRSRPSPDDQDQTELYINTTYRITTGRRTAYISSGGGMPLQCMAAPIRTLLLARRGHDLDICNAHPTLLVQYLDKHAAEGAPDTPCLREYVSKRDEVHLHTVSELHAAGITHATPQHIKPAAVRVMFLGKLGKWFETELGVPASTDPEVACPSLVRLADDYARAAAFVVELNPQALVNATARHAREGKPYRNPVAGAVSQVMCEIETKVVAAIEDCFVRECGLCVRTLIYDGLVVHPVAAGADAIDHEHLRLAEQRALEATGYAIELVEKPLFGAGDLRAAVEFLRTLQQ